MEALSQCRRQPRFAGEARGERTHDELSQLKKQIQMQ
jgi:hypothetical protein